MGTPERKIPLSSTLKLDRCPHCSIAKPRLECKTELKTGDCDGGTNRLWKLYVCSTCGGVVSACKRLEGSFAGRGVQEMFPSHEAIDDAIPERAREYLSQAIESVHAPAGTIMLAASSVDAMLKDQGWSEGHLYTRIEHAATQHLITEEMAKWAHDIRLDANDQRHADESADLPSSEDARRCIEFARALAQFLFVLPARVKRGRDSSKENPSDVSQ